MIKVGIEVPDQNFSGIDLSQPELGNPGVGGSEYLFTLLASQLIKNGLDVIVYHYSSNSLPIGLQIAIQNGHLCHVRRSVCDIIGGQPKTN